MTAKPRNFSKFNRGVNENLTKADAKGTRPTPEATSVQEVLTQVNFTTNVDLVSSTYLFLYTFRLYSMAARR